MPNEIEEIEALMKEEGILQMRPAEPLTPTETEMRTSALGGF
jgi:hypothetical protein